jgi:uncharacterized protein
MIATARLLIKLYLPTCHSLKQKRSYVQSILKKTHNQYNVATAEVDFQDVWQSALIGVSAIGCDTTILINLMHIIEEYIEDNWPDVEILDTTFELL